MTRIGFRRDVKLFMTALVGYLIVVILALLLILQNALFTTEELTRKTWKTVADAMVRDIGREETVSGIKPRLARYDVEFTGRPDLCDLITEMLRKKGLLSA